MAQMVKNPPAMLDTWFKSFGQEYPREKGMATHFSKRIMAEVSFSRITVQSL